MGFDAREEGHHLGVGEIITVHAVNDQQAISLLRHACEALYGQVRQDQVIESDVDSARGVIAATEVEAIVVKEVRDKQHHPCGQGEQQEEGEADSPLSREPDIGLDPRTPRP